MNQASTLFNLKFNPDKGISNTLKTIAITSGKGGVGKTNVVVNLAYAMAQNGFRITVLDADYGLGNIDILLGLDAEYDISDIFKKNLDIEDITVKKNGLNIIPAGSGIQSLSNLSEAQEEKLNRELEKIKDKDDLLLIDTAAGISDNVISLLLSSDEVFLVVNPEPTSIVDAYAVVKVVSELDPFKKFSVIANMVDSEEQGKELFFKLSKVTSKFLNKKLGFLASIMYDRKVKESVRFQKPVSVVYPDNQVTKDFRNLADIVSKKLEIIKN